MQLQELAEPVLRLAMRGDAAPPTDLVSRPQSPPPLASPTTEGEPLWLAAQGGGITLTAGRRLSAGDPPTANTVALLGPPQEHQFLHAIPGEDTKVPLWILGASLYGAPLPGMLCLP